MLFNNLSQEKAAKTLLKSQPDVRQGVFKTLSMKKIASLLEIMPSHEAAAILSMMPLVHNSKVLKLMKPGIADKIGRLLQYDKRTAGALMSTRYTAISENFTVYDLTELIKKIRPQSRHIHYIYVTDDFGKLKGVVSMKYVVMSEKDAPIKDIMKTDVITVSPKTDIDDVFNIITRYDLTALPVVDKEKKLLGVIRVHDMFEILVPSRIKNRMIKAKRLSSSKNG
jgi:Mg/Co/Ni transporter MgtE